MEALVGDGFAEEVGGAEGTGFGGGVEGDDGIRGFGDRYGCGAGVSHVGWEEGLRGLGENLLERARGWWDPPWRLWVVACVLVGWNDEREGIRVS